MKLNTDSLLDPLSSDASFAELARMSRLTLAGRYGEARRERQKVATYKQTKEYTKFLCACSFIDFRDLLSHAHWKADCNVASDGRRSLPPIKKSDSNQEVTHP